MNTKALYVPTLLYASDAPLRNHAVLVEGDRIREAGEVHALEHAHPVAERIDWSGLALFPGTVNAHCHSFQSLLRGMAIDTPFREWRDRSLYRYAPYLDEEAVYAGALLSFGEMLRYGVTTVADFFYVHRNGTANDEAVIQAAKDIGIRLVFARTMYDWSGAPEAYRETVDEAVERTRQLAATYGSDPMVSVCPAPHSLHGASPDMIRAGHRLAHELGTRLHMHIAEEEHQVEQCLREYGSRPIEFLDRLGVVDESLVAVHLCWLADNEIELLGQRGAKLAYCPSSNMFLADGVTNLPALMRAGVRAGLGTDGLCSNNRASIVEEMRMAALLQKVQTLDATALSAHRAFAMGTYEGAEVLGLETGRIAPGCFADFMGVDLSDLSIQPRLTLDTNLLANLVYASQPSAVRRVVVGGREVARDLELLTIPATTIVSRVHNVVAGWPDASMSSGIEPGRRGP